MESFEHDGLILEVYTEGNVIKNVWKGRSRDLNPVTLKISSYIAIVFRLYSLAQ